MFTIVYHSIVLANKAKSWQKREGELPSHSKASAVHKYGQGTTVSTRGKTACTAGAQ